MTRIRKILFIGVPSLIICLVLITIRLLFVEHSYLARTEKLESSLKDARQREEKAVVVRHVSKQMEEIAYQQKEISDKQRKEAEFQASENFRMKLRVEEEWKNAVTAQQEALEAYRLADKQKALAEERQYQAEHSKRVADTLAYLTLGRSLGSLSITQYKTGNTEIASLLAYAAWNFVKRYRGDIYLSSVFNSLFLSYVQPAPWQRHKGGVTIFLFPPGRGIKDTFYTASKYGEILFWEGDGQGNYHTKTLLSDPQYDFRTARMDANGDLYALSSDGTLLRLSQGQWQVLPDKDTLRLPASREDKIRVKTYRGAPMTAFGYCHSNDGQVAIGYSDGTLLLFDSQQKNFRKLVGHRSAITAIEIRQDKLYSCSFDRTIRLWNLSAERPESVVVMESSSWLHSLAYDENGEMLLAGDENGNVYRMCVSPDRMAATIRKKLPRNFTPEEWTYYMGPQIPYEIYTSKKDDL